MKRTLFLIGLFLLTSFKCLADTRSTVTPSGHTLYYTCSAGQVTIEATSSSRYNNYPDLAGDLVIPDSIYCPSQGYGQPAGYYPVRHIAYRAFIGASGLASVVIPNTIMDIGNEAFSYCSNLQSITFNDSLTSIPSAVCSFCPRLRNVTMGDAITSIGGHAFANCDSLETLIIPASVTNIGEAGINSGSLLEIHFRSVTPPNATNYGASYPQYFPFNPQATLYIPCGSLVAYSSGFSYAASYVSFVEEYPYYLTTATADTAMGIVEVLIEPDCASPNAVIYGRSNPRYIFDHWSDNTTQNPRSISVSSDSIIVGYFVSDTNIIHDTTYVDVRDTTYIDVYVHDTTTVVDTVTLTEYVPVHDTTFIDVYIHDTTTIVDTLVLTEYISVHDTTYINIHDTTYITQTDTVTNTVYDTITNTVFDTITNTVFDTITNTIHDTTVVYSTDTLWLHDTVFVHDTIYIHDTIVVGVAEVDAINAKIYTNNGQIVVDGAESNTVWLYDVNGRILATKQDEYSPLHFDVPATGTYLVKIGNHPARKVVVIR